MDSKFPNGLPAKATASQLKSTKTEFFSYSNTSTLHVTCLLADVCAVNQRSTDLSLMCPDKAEELN